ncbi:MAG TPA: thioesterase family protein [Vicinamibacteria bacterium]|nr:thioesterase family protein [Vicinamibacteria bacterium]
MLTNFSFVFPVDVRFRDLDTQGHVNNAVYLTYLESARIVWWQEVTGRTLAEMGMILARTEIDYRSPAAYGDRLEVGLRCVSMGRSSFVLEFRVEERGSGRLVAEARKVLVHYDYIARRSIPIPPELRAKIRARDPGVRED